MSDLGFWKLAQAEPGRIALIDSDEGQWTYGELLARANRSAHLLRGLGVSDGGVVAVVLPNGIDLLSLFLAATQIGLYLTPVNSHLTDGEIAYILADARAEVLIAHERFAGAARSAADRAGLPENRRLAVGHIPGFSPLETSLDAHDPDLPTGRTAGQAMLYTSGTTGRPKGVRRPLTGADPDSTAAVAALLATLFDIPPGRGVHLAAGPLFHTAPLTFATSALHLGNTVVLMDKWTPLRTLELIERHGVTNTHLVPTMFRRLLALPEHERSRFEHGSLRSVIHAAAPCPVGIKQAMLDWWGPVIYEYYAATEGGGTCVSPAEWLERPGTVGRPLPGSEVRILDDEGRDLPTGEPGTVYMRSPLGLFEYHNDADKTRESRHGDFFTVGDVGYLDGDGFLFLCDRKADMIISGGVNIYPAEVEAVLLTHPAVADVAVIGVPNDDWGEEVKAVVEPVSGVTTSNELAHEIVEYCRGRLAHYKCPASIDFLSELPRAETGKLAKRIVRDRYWTGHTARI